MRIDVAFKQTHQTLELTFDNFQRVDGTADYYDGTYDVTPLITADALLSGTTAHDKAGNLIVGTIADGTEVRY